MLKSNFMKQKTADDLQTNDRIRSSHIFPPAAGDPHTSV